MSNSSPMFSGVACLPRIIVPRDKTSSFLIFFSEHKFAILFMSSLKVTLAIAVEDFRERP